MDCSRRENCMNNYNPLPELIPQETIERVKKLSSAQLCDGMIGLGIVRDGCLDGAIMPVSDSMEMVGTAYTVATEEGDNFPIHVAIYQGQPGYVLMVDGKAYIERPYMGDLMASAAKAIGLNGIVVDGFVRDKVRLKELGLPIYTRGFMQRGPMKKGPGKINVQITCGGVCVKPGDLVYGDYDGVTVVPRELIEEVLKRAENKDAYEARRRQAIKEYEVCRAEGKELPDLAPDWVREMLAKQK
jgi:4-hydroxy-4-methyl-2-oxoglutarate aldolase